mmetsp:Transcript_9262/g.19042  ORF Transcript_9262/g.19042 Transcript_9262/m.19042 type:complete len:352 (+) Transcript_9262:131-1186(+)
MATFTASRVVPRLRAATTQAPPLGGFGVIWRCAEGLAGSPTRPLAVSSRGFAGMCLAHEPVSPLTPSRFMGTKVRDPEMPKRPVSPWLRFLKQFRKDRPDIKHKEFMAAAAADWKSLSPNSKAPFESAYHVDKVQYDRDYQAFVDRWRRDPERPKKPPTAYLAFAADVRSQNPTLKASEQAKLAGGKWKAMSAAEKQPYQNRVAPQVESYREQMKAYKDSGKEAAWKERRGMRDPEKPKRPVSGFFMFVAEVRAQNPSLKVTEQAKLAGGRWKAMSAEEKAPFERRAAPQFERFKQQLQAYKDSGKEAAWKQKRELHMKAIGKASRKEAKAKVKGRPAEGKGGRGRSEARG